MTNLTSIRGCEIRNLTKNSDPNIFQNYITKGGQKTPPQQWFLSL